MLIEEIEQELRDALSRLYDASYEPSDVLYSLTGSERRDGALGVQSAIIKAIEDLKPHDSAPTSAQVRQLHGLLHNRFILKLTQEETAERMHMSLSSTRRAQRTAVHTLARVLWEQSQPGGQAIAEADQLDDAQNGEALDIQAADWQSQTKQELASLRASAPETISDVAETINGVLALGKAIAGRDGQHLQVGFVQPHLTSAIHPSALRQVLISAIRRMSRYAPVGDIAIYAGLEDGDVKITITGAVQAGQTPSESDLITDILLPDGTDIGARIDDQRVFLWIEAPSVGRITVLVVDDNADMIRFYRRSTEGTRYHIVHLEHGQELFEAMESLEPDIIVLDVMLPDTDGWELLMRLHEDLVTRPIPVIICSVVRERDLALSLGAAEYLSKPVRRREFIEALDQVLPPT